MKERMRTLQVGKLGITENVVGEIKTQLKTYRFLRVKILRAAKGEKSSKEIAEEVAAHAKAKLLDVRGNTFVLEKK